MKKSIFTLVLAIASVALSAQTFTAKTSSGGGFNVDSGESLGETVTIDGEVFDLYATESGSKYVKLTSPRTGNDYPLWIGTPTEYKFEGRTVYQSRKGSYCVYIVSKNSGNPYAKWLDMTE